MALPPPSARNYLRPFPPAPSRSEEPSPRGGVFLGIIVAAVIAAAGVTGGGLCFVYRMFQSLPTLDQLENIQQPLVSVLIGRDGTVVHEFGTERRFWVSIDSMPEAMAQAVVAIEDRKFYRHWGIDLKRIFGAMAVDLVAREYAQGASTITQQLARNLYLTSRQSMVRKIREMLTAVQIERRYAKREILELYLNQVYLGAGAYGVEAASQRYFSKPVSSLSVGECATIAGIIQLPERYRPDRPTNLKRTAARRNTVLRAMAAMGFIKRKESLALMQDSVSCNPQEVAAKRAPYFVEAVRQYVSEKYGEALLYEGGLSIYTTLDPEAQDTAETAATVHLKTLQRRLNRMCVDSSAIWRELDLPRDTLVSHFDSLYALHRAEFARLPDSVRLRAAQVSVVAIDVKTGGVLCLTGGRNFAESKFNRALQALRQPGSAFKPFVYTAAIDSGLTPATEVLDQAITLTTPGGDEWRPENFDREFYGKMAIRQALYKSVNLVAIQVLMQIGGEAVVACARRMGINTPLAPVPSLAIGACEVIPMEIISAYSAYPGGGLRMDPYLVEKIVDKNGKVLEEHTPRSTTTLSPQTAFLMADMMCDVVRRGTAASIPGRGFTRPAGGKTGTTNDYSDAWFIGFTPQIVCGVWVGVDERRSLGRGVTGADGAIPIWVPVMLALHRALPVQNFHRPDGIVTENICLKSHLLATSYCQETRTEYFREGNVPMPCDMHAPGRGRGGFRDDFGGGGSRDRSVKQPRRSSAF